MKRPNPNTRAEVSHLEEPDDVGPVSGTVLPGEETTQSTVRDDAARDAALVHLRLLWESRRLLGRAVAAGLVLSVVVAVLIPSRYQSTARLMPPDSPAAGGLSAAMAALSAGPNALGGLAGGLLGLKSTSDLLVGILTSRTVADQLVRQFDLRRVYGARRVEDARNVLATNTSTVVDRKSQIITITVTDQDAQRAAALAQAYIGELNRLVAEVSTSSARRERIFLEGRLQAVNRELEAAEKEFSQFASKNTAIDIKEQGKAMLEAAATLQGQLIAARSELEGLRQIYADSNVRVRSAKARVAELENQIKKVGGMDEGTSLENLKPSDALYPSIRKLPLLGVTYADLYRKTKVQEALFETLTQEYELAKVQEAKEIPTVKVLDPPNLPENKSSPPRTLIVLLGTALVSSLGVVYVLGKTRWEGTDPADPGKILAQEVFDTVKASIPWVSRNGSGPHKEGLRHELPHRSGEGEAGDPKS